MQIRIWLSISTILVLAIIILGGYTRLSNSGLSIVEWHPVSGVIPPLNHHSWEQEFSQYKQSPEYQKINYGMSLKEFKSIFMVEYAHRMLARIAGVVFLLPFLYFAIFTKILARKEIVYFTVIALFFAVQGGIGWFMVASGLIDQPHVSQYRLALHLVTACVIITLLVWKATPKLSEQRLPASLYYYSCFTLGLLLLQITSGAFVAGLDAGMVYNSFPLMDGQFIPDGLNNLRPYYKNFFENIITVQFIHRCLGILNVVNIIIYCLKIFNIKSCILKKISVSLASFVVLQFVLGVLTLILRVPLPIALLHQACAMIILIIMVALLKQTSLGYIKAD